MTKFFIKKRNDGQVGEVWKAMNFCNEKLSQYMIDKIHVWGVINTNYSMKHRYTKLGEKYHSKMYVQCKYNEIWPKLK